MLTPLHVGSSTSLAIRPAQYNSALFYACDACVQVVPHPGLTAANPKGHLTELLEAALSEYLPDASQLEQTHKQRMDACRMATGCDIEDAAVTKVTGGDWKSR